MRPVALDIPDEGAYTNAYSVSPSSSLPPANKTLPSGSKALFAGPLGQGGDGGAAVGLKVPATRSYSSAVASAHSESAIKTLPFESNVAEGHDRGAVMSPAAAKEPVEGS